MPITVLNGVGGSGGSIAEDMFFNSIEERDIFTNDNPTRLQQGIVCAVLASFNDTTLYQYFQYDDAGFWRATDLIYQGRRGPQGLPGVKGDTVNAAEFQGDDIVFSDDAGNSFPLVDAVETLKGPEGEAAPTISFQFSRNVDGPWVGIVEYQENPTAYQYWRQSNDGGDSWTPGVRLRASVQDLPDGYGWFSDGEGALQLRKDGALILNITTDQVTSETLKVLNGIIEFGASKALYDGVENVIFKNKVTGTVFHPVWQNADNGRWRGFVRTKGLEGVRQNYLDGLVEPNLSTTTSSTLVLNVRFSQRIYSLYASLPIGKPNCTLRVLQNGQNKLTITGINLTAGENHIVLKDTELEQPFFDVLEGQTYVLQLLDANGSQFDVHVEQGGTTPWWAADFTGFEDKEVLHEGSLGDGLEFNTDEHSINLQQASTDTIGGVKVGVGLGINPDGTLYSTVSGSIVKPVNNEAERLALPQIEQAYTCIQADVEQIFLLDSNTDPSVADNWINGGSTASAVQGFKGAGDSTPREGVVVAKRGDYTHDMVTATDVTTGTKYILVMDNGQPFMESI